MGWRVWAKQPRPVKSPHMPLSSSDVVSLIECVHKLYNDLKDQVPKEGCKIAHLKCDYIDNMLK